MTRRLAASLQKKFGAILTSQKTFFHFGSLPAHAFPPRVCEIPGTCDLTLENVSQACCESAEKVCVDSNKPGNFSHFGSLPAHALPPT